jgi:RHS repeat-associated protein
MKFSNLLRFFLIFILGILTANAQSADDLLKGPESSKKIDFKIIKSKSFNAKQDISSRAPIGPIDDPIDPNPIDPPPPATSSEAGSTAGDLSVSLTGAATYTIPFSLPPGIKDVIPSIGLSFSSQAANGLAGWGWNIYGLSTITRIPSTKFHDGLIDGVDFDTYDRFAIDGQRLMLKSGSYGAANSEYQTESYSNIKVKAYGTSPYGSNYGPSYFIVFYPNGTRAWYGNAGSSRGRLEWAIYKWQDPQGNYIQYDYLQSNGLLRINTIKYGSNGNNSPINEIKFYYKTRIRPELSYVGGLAFKRTNIIDKIEVYGKGQLFRKYTLTHPTTNSLGYQLLTSVTESNGLGKSLTPINFNYESPTPNSLNRFPNSHTIYPGINYDTDQMVSGEFNGDGKMDFLIYNKNTKNKINLFTNLFGSNITVGYEINTGSFDGVFGSNILSSNGKLLSQQGITTASETIESTIGKVKFSTFAMAAYGPVFQYDKTWNTNTYSYASDCNNSSRKKIPKEYISGDFNGDGLTDVIAITKPYTSRSCYQDCSGTGLLPKQAKSSQKGEFESQKNKQSDSQRVDPIDPGCSCNCNGYTTSASLAYFIDLDRTKTTNFVNSLGYLQAGFKATDKILAADFNGDGKSDLFHFTDGKLYVYELDSNNSLQLLYTAIDSYIKTNVPILLADYNGDGKTDFAVPTANNNNTWRFFLSTGTNFYIYSKSIDVTYHENKVDSGTHTVNGVSMSDPLYEYHYIAQDFNGDHKGDILEHEVVSPYSSYNTVSETIRLHINRFNTSDTTPSFLLTTFFQQNNNGLTKFGIPIFLDAKFSNNNLEYAYIDGNNIYAYEFLKDNKKDVTLKSINNNGIVSNISYEKMDNDPNNYSQIYTPDYSQNYPYVNVNIAPSLQLVSSISQTGDGITRNQEFQYVGAVSNMQGLGFLGFNITKKSNWFGSGVAELWNISVHSPQLRGAVTQQWVSQSSSSTPSGYTSKTDYTYNTQLLPNNVFINVPTQVVTEDYLQGFSTTQSYNYDTYYNPLSVTTTFPGGSKEVSYTYINNTTSTDQFYHIGRPTDKVEMSTLNGETYSTEEQYTYNNNLLVKKLKKGNGTPWITENLSYDVFGNVIQKSLSASGISARTENYEYDSSGRFLTKSTNIEGLSTSFSYNLNNGNPLTTTDPYGFTTTFESDGWNRLTKGTDYLNNSTTYTYTPVTGGGYSKLTNYALGQDEEVTYNAFGWVTKSRVLGLNNKWTQKSFEYDVIGRKIKESEPYFSNASPTFWNSSTFDNYGRQISKQSYTGKVTTFTYNGLSVTVDDGSKSVTTTKDAAGNIIKVQDSGGIIDYTYFANGSLKKANYADHIVTTNIDGWGRKISLSDSSAGTYTYTYNILGDILEESSPKGTTTYVYDSYGKIISKNITGDNTNLSLVYNYNGTSKLLESINGADTGNQKTYNYTYQYDNYKRLINTIEDNDLAHFEKQVAYDSYGNVFKETYVSNNKANNVSSTVKIRNVYNNAGIVYEIQNFDTSESLWKLVNENENGNPTEINLGNGLKKTRQYNQFGFLTQINDYDPSTSAYVLKLDYDFNAQTGNLNSRKNHGFNWLENFTYDNLDRLTTINGPVPFTQNYDNRGRITDNSTIGQYNYSTTNKYRLNDIVLNTQGDSYYQNHTLQQIKYNAFKKPVEIFEEGKGRVNFEYGPLGNRSQAYYGGLNENKLQRNFYKHYSAITPVEIVENRTDNSTKIITYIGGNAYSAPIAYIKNTKAGSSNGYHYLHRDYLGSILTITNARGIVKEQRQFGAWGEVDKFVGLNGNTTFDDSSLISRGYTGHEHFFGVGLIHMNGRMYDAKLGRFLSPDNYIQDPFSTQSYNRYGYVWNNPLKYTDPSGELSWRSIGKWIARNAGVITTVLTIATAAVLTVATAGIASPLLAGAIVGFGAGFVGGAVGTWTHGGSFGSGLFNGLIQGGIGAISGAVGAGVGRWATKSIGTVINGWDVASPVLKGSISGAISGSISGYAAGFTVGFITSGGDLSLANKSGMNGFKLGLGLGAITGGAGAYRISKANGIDPWSGKIKNYPSNDGFSGSPKSSTLEPKTIIDRYGGETGKYAAPQGTTFNQRSMFGSENNYQLNRYEVVKPLPVLEGRVAPWFFKSGGGVQYKLYNSIKWYRENGYIIKL